MLGLRSLLRPLASSQGLMGSALPSLSRRVAMALLRARRRWLSCLARAETGESGEGRGREEEQEKGRYLDRPAG